MAQFKRRFLAVGAVALAVLSAFVARWRYRTYFVLLTVVGRNSGVVRGVRPNRSV